MIPTVNTILRATFALSLSFLCIKTYSQSPACPSINAQAGTGPSTTVCQGNCVNLTATVIPINLNTTYSVQSIPYTPYSFNTGTSIIANTDDVWSATTPLGFNFCYFGNTFNQCKIGSNGQLTFSTAVSSAVGANNWSINGPLPNLADMPGNTICAAFRDTDPSSSGNIYFAYYGAAPCRALVVSWDNIPLFDNPGSCSGVSNSTFQMVLYETTNYIDVYIQNSSACTGPGAWNGGYGIVGIQNANGTLGYSPPSRNHPNAWTAVNEAWRFVPTGTPQYTVTWSDPTGPIGSNLTLNVCPMTTTNYTATMQVNSCSAGILSYSSVTQVSVVPGPTLSVNSATLCQGETATLTANGAANYTWMPGGSNTSSIVVSPASTIQYTVLGTQAGPSCISSGTADVIVNSAIAAVAGNNGPICSGNALSLTTSAGANTYNWTGPNGFTSAQQNPSIPNTTGTESGVYSVTLTSISGCTTTASTSATVILLPVPTATNNGPLCSGSDLSLTGGGSTLYSWTGPNGFSSNLASPTIPNASSAASGLYTLLAGVGTCTASVSTNVLINPSPVAQALYSGAVCEGLPVYFTGNGGTTYSWIGPDGFVTSAQNPTLNATTFNSNGVYSLTVADAIGCSNTATINVQVYPAPTADFNFAPIRPVINGENDVYFTDASHNATVTSWSWYFMNTAEHTSTSQNPHFLYEDPGDYVVALVVKSDKGCIDTLLKTIKIYEDYGIYVPNVFTPNADGVNDVFQPKGFGISKYELNIFDRWGELLFSTKEFTQGWDGTIKGRLAKPAADGSYVWQIKLTNVFGEAKELTGHVILMK